MFDYILLKQPAHIVRMGRLLFIALLWLSAIVLLLFFPIYIESDTHYDMNRRKFTFAVYLYGFLKLIGGYATTYQGGFALHVSKKKAILLPYAELNSERKRFSFVKTFRLVSLRLTTETGAEYLFPITLLQTLLRAYLFFKPEKRGKIENNVWLTDGDELRISFNSVIFFNLFIILINFLKFLKEKMKILWRRKTKKSIA